MEHSRSEVECHPHPRMTISYQFHLTNEPYRLYTSPVGIVRPSDGCGGGKALRSFTPAMWPAQYPRGSVRNPVMRGATGDLRARNIGVCPEGQRHEREPAPHRLARQGRVGENTRDARQPFARKISETKPVWSGTPAPATPSAWLSSPALSRIRQRAISRVHCNSSRNGEVAGRRTDRGVGTGPQHRLMTRGSGPSVRFASTSPFRGGFRPAAQTPRPRHKPQHCPALPRCGSAGCTSPAGPTAPGSPS